MISSEKSPSIDQARSNIILPYTDPAFLSMTTEMKQNLEQLLKTARRPGVPNFWEGDLCEQIRIPVQDGEILVYHYDPKNKISKRPLVFIPGWGVNPGGFQDLFIAIYKRVEMYYIETREKKSSKIRFLGSKFTMQQKTRDVFDALTHLDLDGTDYILMGCCWGAAVIMQGLIDDKLTKAPTVVTFDPMHRIWFSKFALKWITPLIPTFMFTILKPIIKWAKLHNMQEPTQKKRANAFIADAVMWKWKRAAQQVNDFELFGHLSGVQKEVFVINGTSDLIHDQRDYPRIASELSNSRFLFMGTDESNRELLMGVVAEEFTKIFQDEALPHFLQPYEKKILR